MEVETAALPMLFNILLESAHKFDTYTFIYSSSSNTYMYLVTLLLETCTFPLYVLRHTIYLSDFGCCRLKFIFHSKLDLNTYSVELPGRRACYE